MLRSMAVVKGWQEGLLTSRVESKAVLTVPSESSPTGCEGCVRDQQMRRCCLRWSCLELEEPLETDEPMQCQCTCQRTRAHLVLPEPAERDCLVVDLHGVLFRLPSSSQLALWKTVVCVDQWSDTQMHVCV